MRGPIKILIADDHPIVRNGLATVLNQEEDLEVVGQARNGLEAMSKIKEEAPDIAIIILTTYETDDYIFRGIEAGARAYLLKDSPPEEVVKAIRAVHQGESLIQPRVASRLLDRFSQLSHAARSEGSLSSREVEVTQLMAKGKGNKEIATSLIIGESTVKTHLIHIFNKLGVKGRTEAVAEAARRGIIKL